MNNLKSIQPIPLVKSTKPEKKAKVKKAVTKPKKEYIGKFLGFPISRNSQGEVTFEILDFPSKPVKLLQCYNCKEVSAQPNVNGKVQHFVWNAKEKTAHPVPPNCPKCHSLRMGTPKEMIEAGYEDGKVILSPKGQRLDVTRDDGSNILNIKQSYLAKNSDMDDEQIENIVLYDVENDGTMDAFENALPLSNFVKVGYVAKEKERTNNISMIPDESTGYYDKQCSDNGEIEWLAKGHAKYCLKKQKLDMIQNKIVKDMTRWYSNYNTEKMTNYQINTWRKNYQSHYYWELNDKNQLVQCQKLDKRDPSPKLSYFQMESLLKSLNWEKNEAIKANNQSNNRDYWDHLEKINILRTRVITGDMYVGDVEESKEVYKKDYEKETMDREFKSLVQDKDLGVNVQNIDLYKIAKKVERMNELIVN